MRRKSVGPTLRDERNGQLAEEEFEQAAHDVHVEPLLVVDVDLVGAAVQLLLQSLDGHRVAWHAINARVVQAAVLDNTRTQLHH